MDAYKAFIEFGHSAKAHKIMESRLKNMFVPKCPNSNNYLQVPE